ncbi:MAG: SufD family Fe-S cluster assembly protein, partial [Proteobacteria bacterium]|nr:SufD family Fe-S cluster assembly protein [Pseudomonadota bacterium]
GELDENSLFYLLSRGIPHVTARRMLIEAFLSEAIAEIPLLAVAEDFSTHVRQWLAGHIDRPADGAGS